MAKTLTAPTVASRATVATLLSAILPRVLAVLLLAAAGLGAWHYPYAPIPLALGLLAYAALGLWRPPLLLVMLPLWLTLVNLAPWSGSLYLEDYDLMLAVTLAVLLGRGLYATRIRLTHWQWVFLGLLVTSYTVSMLRGLLPLPEWTPAELSTYYSRWYALRLGKGFFWALLLLPGMVALLRHDHARARLAMAWGLALCGLAIGGVALWERGVLEALFRGDGLYAVAKSLLDFSTHYRITGLFSEMHTGGEAIDGFIALIWPFGIIAAVGSRSRWGVALGTLCLLGVLYAGVTTFSRVTYAALLIGGATAGMLWMLVRGDRVGEKRQGRFEWSGLLGLPVPLLMPYLFTQGGVPTLGAGLLCWAASYALGALAACRTFPVNPG